MLFKSLDRTRALLLVIYLALVLWTVAINYYARELTTVYAGIGLGDTSNASNGFSRDFERGYVSNFIERVRNSKVDLDFSRLLAGNTNGTRIAQDTLLNGFVVRPALDRDELEILDPPSKSIVRRVKLDTSFSYREGVLMGHRYWVAADSDPSFIVFDLVKPESSPVKFPLESHWKFSQFTTNRVEGSELAWVTVSNVSEGEATLAMVFSARDGTPRVLGTIPVDAWHPDFGMAAFGEQIVSMAEDNKDIEFRSIADLSLIRTLPIPSEISNNPPLPSYKPSIQSRLTVRPPYVFAKAFKSVYRLKDGSAVKELDGLDPCFDSDSPRFLLLKGDVHWDGAEYCVWDSQQEKVVVRERLTDQFAYVRGSSYLRISSNCGLTIEEIDLNQPMRGCVRRIQPFGWIRWSLPLLFMSFATWMFAWARIAARDGISTTIWIDVALVAFFCLVMFGGRMVAKSYWRTDAELGGSEQALIGILLGLTHCGSWNLFQGREAFGKRILIAIFTGCVVVVTPSFLEGLSSKELTPRLQHLLITVSIVTLLSLFLAATVYLLRYRWRNGECRLEQVWLRFSLIDCLWLMTSVAILFPAVKWLLKGPSVDLFSLISALPSLTGVAALVSLAGTLSLQTSSWIFQSSAYIVSLLTIGLLAEAYWEFVAAGEWNSTVLPDIQLNRIVGAAIISVFLFGVGLRLRGVRGGLRRRDRIATLHLENCG